MDTARLVNSFDDYVKETEHLDKTFVDNILNFIVTPYFIPLFILCFTIYSVIMHKRGKRAYHILDTSLIIGLIVIYAILLSLAVGIQKPFVKAEEDFKTELFLTYLNTPDLDVAGVNLSLGSTQEKHERNKELYKEYGVYIDIDGDGSVEPVYVKKTNKYAEGTVLHVDFKTQYQGVLDWSEATPKIYMYETTNSSNFYKPLTDIEYIYIIAP